ncbi:MAG: hypothetical protein EZS28_052684, partial [Streblomastix strix]
MAEQEQYLEDPQLQSDSTPRQQPIKDVEIQGSVRKSTSQMRAKLTTSNVEHVPIDSAAIWSEIVKNDNKILDEINELEKKENQRLTEEENKLNGIYQAQKIEGEDPVKQKDKEIADYVNAHKERLSELEQRAADSGQGLQWKKAQELVEREQSINTLMKRAGKVAGSTEAEGFEEFTGVVHDLVAETQKITGAAQKEVAAQEGKKID